MSKQAGASAGKSESLLHQGPAFEAYKAGLLRAINAIEAPEVVPTENCVYIAKPSSLTAFYEIHADAIIARLGIDPSSLWGYEKRLGGQLFKFKQPEAARVFASSFPLELTISAKVHVFQVSDTPTIFQGVRVRVVGLPVPFPNEKLRDIAELLAMEASDVVHAEVIKSRAGVATEKGLIIFKVAPPMLLATSSLQLHNSKLMFYWMDKDAQCEFCTHKGHHRDSCPSALYESLPIFESDEVIDDKNPDEQKKDDKGKDKKKEQVPKSPARPPVRRSPRHNNNT